LISFHIANMTSLDTKVNPELTYADLVMAINNTLKSEGRLSSFLREGLVFSIMSNIMKGDTREYIKKLREEFNTEKEDCYNTVKEHGMYTRYQELCREIEAGEELTEDPSE
jgi:hypothetical protein